MLALLEEGGTGEGSPDSATARQGLLHLLALACLLSSKVLLNVVAGDLGSAHGSGALLHQLVAAMHALRRGAPPGPSFLPPSSPAPAASEAEQQLAVLFSDVDHHAAAAKSSKGATASTYLDARLAVWAQAYAAAEPSATLGRNGAARPVASTGSSAAAAAGAGPTSAAALHHLRRLDQAFAGRVAVLFPHEVPGHGHPQRALGAARKPSMYGAARGAADAAARRALAICRQVSHVAGGAAAAVGSRPTTAAQPHHLPQAPQRAAPRRHGQAVGAGGSSTHPSCRQDAHAEEPHAAGSFVAPGMGAAGAAEGSSLTRNMAHAVASSLAQQSPSPCPREPPMVVRSASLQSGGCSLPPTRRHGSAAPP